MEQKEVPYLPRVEVVEYRRGRLEPCLVHGRGKIARLLSLYIAHPYRSHLGGLGSDPPFARIRC